MNKIKEVMFKAFPKIYELYKEIGYECVKEGCNGCPLYNISFRINNNGSFPFCHVCRHRNE